MDAQSNASPAVLNSGGWKRPRFIHGFFAITEEDWVGNLERFRGNLGLTSALGSAARKTVEESFSLRATVPNIAEILTAAAALRHHGRRAASQAIFRPGQARSAGSGGAAASR